jgi:glycine oxidase
MQESDYLIVGGGIAGSVLALSLLKKQQSVLLIDQPELSSSSRIAAGIFTSFNFQRMAPFPEIERKLQIAYDFYRYAETVLGKPLMEVRALLRVPDHIEETEAWKLAVEKFGNHFVETDFVPNPYPQIMDAPWGFGMVHHCGQVDVAQLLESVRGYLIERQLFAKEKFEHAKLQLTENGIVYDNRISAKRIIFCEGYLTKYNPFFSFVKIHPVKGQLLQGQIQGLNTDQILNGKVYLFQKKDQSFLVGATFENGDEDETVTAAGREQLMQQLNLFLKAEMQLTGHYVGIRPCTLDHQPIIGMHPEFSQIGLLNGLASKGVLHAPWLAEQLIDHIENGLAIPKLMSINRFWKKKSL